MAQQTGIPSVERFVARWLIGRWCRRNPPERTCQMLREQEGELRALFAAAADRATTRVQIKRLPGLESSSTNYSLAMVADHLARVNSDIAITLGSLARNERGTIEVRTANYKPSPDAAPDASLAALDRSILALESVLADTGPIRRSRVGHVHPWFGELPATTWACFPAFHQALHMKQARLIAAGL
ncbi:MAG: DinB family protein [Phycisphaeraceae bacterium]|nr:DinB family protein [Phycisphaeraceae bacterium]